MKRVNGDIPNSVSSTEGGGLYKPGKCPVLPKLESCENQVYQCNYDVDCWDSEKKCCDNGCVTTCVDPVFTTHSRSTPALSTTGPHLKTDLKTGKSETFHIL